MTTQCQPLPRSVAEGMLRFATRVLCDRPAHSREQRDTLTQQMVHVVLGFEPRDGLEYMIATLVFGHYETIMDSMHDLFQGQIDTMKARTKSGIVAMDRMMLAYVRELRLIRRRPLAQWAVDAQREAEARAAAETPLMTPDGAEMPDAADAPPAAPEPMAPPMPPFASMTAESAAAPAAAGAAEPAGAAAAPSPTPPCAAPIKPPAAEGAPTASPATVALAATTPASAATILEALMADPAGPADQSPWTPEDEVNFERHIAEFHQAVIAMTETLQEARALGAPQTDTATGD